MSFKTEIERRFLVNKLPDLTEFKLNNITQWYIFFNSFISYRLRLYDDGRCYIDIKLGKGKKRLKLGYKCKFEDYKIHVVNCPYVSKIRYKKYIDDDILLIIDKFEDGLIICEIESRNGKNIDNYMIPEWIGKEITDKYEYNNRFLAKKNDFF